MIIKFLLNFTLPFFFCVKDLYSGRLLLHAPSKGGLYPWPSTSPAHSVCIALIGERVSIDQWYNRLGYPATLVVRRILSKHRLLVLSQKSAPLCPAYQQGKMHKLHFGVSLSVSKDPILSSNNKRYFL